MISFLILIIIVLSIGAVLKISKKLGYRKSGIAVSLLILSPILLILINVLFEDELFTKSDMKNILMEHSVVLKDDFKVIHKSLSNSRVNSIQFEIAISESDSRRIVASFEKSEHLIELTNNQSVDILQTLPNSIQHDTVLYAVYNKWGKWNLKYYKVLKNKYVQTEDYIGVANTENRVYFKRNQ